MVNNPKVLIIQNFIPFYREHIYNLIGKESQLVIAHSGSKSSGLQDVDQVILKNRKIGSLNIQSNLINQLGNKDLVIAMFDLHWLSSILSCFYCKWKKIPFYWWGHGLGSSKLFNYLRLFLLRFSDGLILYSSHSKAIFISKGIDSKKLFVAPNTIHIENSSFDSKVEKKHFLFVGGLRNIKRIPELIDAFALFKQELEYRDIRLFIVGNGPMLEDYMRIVKSLDLSNEIVFTGSITDNVKLKNLFQRSYAYVSPGDVGLGVLHSFAYGIPVITRHAKYANHGPEFHNIIHNENGLIYNGNINSLVDCMKRLVNEKILSLNLGVNAYEFYQTQRRPSHMIEDMLSLVDNVRQSK